MYSFTSTRWFWAFEGSFRPPRKLSYVDSNSAVWARDTLPSTQEIFLVENSHQFKSFIGSMSKHDELRFPLETVLQFLPCFYLKYAFPEYVCACSHHFWIFCLGIIGKFKLASEGDVWYFSPGFCRLQQAWPDCSTAVHQTLGTAAAGRRGEWRGLAEWWGRKL